MKHIHQVACAKKIPELTSDVSLTAQPLFSKFDFCIVQHQSKEIRGIVVQNAFMKKHLQEEPQFDE